MKRSNLVIKTKLAVPRIKSKTLERRRLVNALMQNLDKKLILLCGNAGYGKTTILAQLSSKMKEPYMYYCLGRTDNDLTTFFHYLVTGICQTHKDFGDVTTSILDQTRDHEIIVGTFINEFFGSIHDEFYIILDDFHNIQTNQHIMHAFEYLMRHLPANLHIVIASRATPPLDLSYYFTKQELYEMDARTIRFKHEETRALLLDVHQLSLSEKYIERIIEHSQGWVTAIQLMAQEIATSGVQHAQHTLNGYVASGEELFSYFAREVFEHQPARVQDFMMKTSFLRTLEPKMCNHVLKIRSSAKILKNLEQEHAFINRTGATAYMYHPLFRKFIQDRAIMEFSRGTVRSLYRSIGEYFKEQGDSESAVDIYLRGTLYSQAVGIIKTICGELIETCRFNRMLQWLTSIPDTRLKRDLRLQNIYALALWHSMRIDEALAIYERVAKTARRQRKNRHLFDALYGIARVHAAQGDFASVMKLLERCLAIPRIPGLQRVDVYNLMGIGYVYLNEFSRAEQAFNKAVAILKKHGSITRHPSLMNNLAIVAFTRGELKQSVKMFRKLVKSHAQPLAEGHIYANIALALIDLGQLEKAKRALVASFRSSRRYVNTRAFHQFMLGLGFYYLEKYNFARAEEYFSRALAISVESQERLSEQKARHGLLKTQFLAQNTSEAQAILKEILRTDIITPGVRNHDVFLLKGLIELQAREYKTAEKTLLDAHAMVKGTEFKYSIMKSLYACAFLYWRMGRKKSIIKYLEGALKMAREHGYEHYLVRQARYSSGLLEFAEEQGIQNAYTKKIVCRVIRTTPVRVSLFGAFEVFLNEILIKGSQWQTRKSQVVFAYCMLNRTKPIAKDVLIATFSSQERPAQADQDIRTTISRMQRALPWKRIIRYARGFYHVFPDLDVTIDTEEFERLSDHVIEHTGPFDPRMRSSIHQILALYRGDFLVGFYDQWSDTMRNHYKERYMVILKKYAAYCQQNTEHEQALQAYQKILAINPLDEPAHKGILQCLHVTGRSSEARARYREFREKMKQETGITLPKTVAQYLKTR